MFGRDISSVSKCVLRQCSANLNLCNDVLRFAGKDNFDVMHKLCSRVMSPQKGNMKG